LGSEEFDEAEQHRIVILATIRSSISSYNDCASGSLAEYAIELVTGRSVNPTALYVEQASAHFFSYTQEEDGRLTGGEVVAPCALPMIRGLDQKAVPPAQLNHSGLWTWRADSQAATPML
jgi:hypothetical protein